MAVCSKRPDEIFSTAEGPESVSSALLSLRIPPTTEIVVSWDAETAVETTWEIFRTYWDDFCYPSSDDVSIWSRRERWSLCYHHAETFSYNRGT